MSYYRKEAEALLLLSYIHGFAWMFFPARSKPEFFAAFVAWFALLLAGIYGAVAALEKP